MTRTRDQRFTEQHVPPAWVQPPDLSALARRDFEVAERLRWLAENLECE